MIVIWSRQIFVRNIEIWISETFFVNYYTLTQKCYFENTKRQVDYKSDTVANQRQDWDIFFINFSWITVSANIRFFLRLRQSSTGLDSFLQILLVPFGLNNFWTSGFCQYRLLSLVTEFEILVNFANLFFNSVNFGTNKKSANVGTNKKFTSDVIVSFNNHYFELCLEQHQKKVNEE